MKKYKFYNLVLSAIFALSLTQCLGGATSTGGERSTGDDIFNDPSFSFDASSGNLVTQLLPIPNTSSSSMILTNVSLTNNLCNAFSVIQIENSQQNILARAGEPVFIEVLPGQTVYARLRFSPIYCPQFNQYQTKVNIDKNINGTNIRDYYNLNVTGVAPEQTVELDSCPEEELNPDEYIPLIRSGVPCAGTYYLKVESMQALIIVIKAFDNSTVMATNLETIPLGAYEPAYLPIIVGEKREVEVEGELLPRQVADFTIPEVDRCARFRVPSPSDDAFFGGAYTEVVTKGEASGRLEFISDFDQGVRKTVMSTPSLKIKLRASGLDTLIANPDGIFQIALETPLTTETSVASEYLGDPYRDIVAANNVPEDLMSIANLDDEFVLDGFYTDQGVRLVGIGSFSNEDEDFLGDDSTAKNFLIDNPALLAIQLNMVWTYKEDEIAEGCGNL
jgi:hypothetical protein